MSELVALGKSYTVLFYLISEMMRGIDHRFKVNYGGLAREEEYQAYAEPK